MIISDALKALSVNDVKYTLIGDDTLSFDCFVPLNEAGPGDAVMIRETGDVDAKISQANSLKPSLAVVPSNKTREAEAGAVVSVKNPRLAFALIQRELSRRDEPESDYPDLPRWVFVGKNVFIDKFCNIGGDGLSANKHMDGLVHTPHTGRVVIGDNVRVHSFCAIERAVMGETRIGDDCHIDYHCVIGHGATMGKRCRLAPGVLILGGAVVGDDVAIGAGAVVNPGIKIGDGAAIGSGSVVARDVKAGILVCGNPARQICQVDDSGKTTW